MDIIKAREIIHLLAESVDPSTREVLPKESIFNSPDVIRALYTVQEETAPRSADPLRNASKPWTETEDDKLRDEFFEKVKISDIAKEHVRSYGVLKSRLDHLGQKRRPFCLFRLKNRNSGVNETPESFSICVTDGKHHKDYTPSLLPRHEFQQIPSYQNFSFS